MFGEATNPSPPDAPCRLAIRGGLLKAPGLFEAAGST